MNNDQLKTWLRTQMSQAFERDETEAAKTFRTVLQHIEKNPISGPNPDCKKCDGDGF